jgi:hypothetical protein
MRFALLVLVSGASALAAAALPAQAVPLPGVAPDSGEYAPRHALPNGRQLVVVYVGMTGCGASRDPELKRAVRRMKPLVARQADSLGRALSIAGVALDWQPDSGAAYLRSLGMWDEMVVGNNWVNLGAERYIWGEQGGRPSIPQVIVYERTVRPAKSRIAFGLARRLGRYVGTEEIIGWVERGAPLPRPAAAAERRPPAG